MARKLAGWKEKLLGKAGKEILIKAVAQAIPTYSMSCFRIPDSFCDELTSLIRNFWWGQKKDEHKMAWISWEKLCTPKSKGGDCNWVGSLCCTRFSKQNIFLTMISFKPRWVVILHMHDVALWWLKA